MELAAKIAGIGIIAGILAVMVRKYNPEIAMQISIAAGILLFILIADQLAYAVGFIQTFAEQYTGFYDGIMVVLKIVGIAYLAEFSVQILKDAGEGSIASKVELAAKVIIMVLTLPLMEQFAQMVLGLL